MYQNYKKARDAAWETLIRHGVSSLPVDVFSLCRGEGILLLSYSEARKNGLLSLFGNAWRGTDGFAVFLCGRKLIFYRESCKPGRLRFTIAHELGHYALGDVSSVPTKRNREPSGYDNEIETRANLFAARILSPACVLHALGVTKPRQISAICEISPTAAKWRCKRLLALYRREKEWLATRGRSCFFLSPLEIRVYRQFEPYIKKVHGSFFSI